MVQSFKSPLFSGIGFSSHEITVENLARTRKQALKDQAKAEAAAAKAEETNTPLNNFINNLQARIYSQLAAQITDSIFANNAAVDGGRGLTQTFGVINLQGGATVTWQMVDGMVTLYIVDPSTGKTTEIQVPVDSLHPGGG